MISVFFSELFSNFKQIDSIVSRGKSIENGTLKGDNLIFDIDYEMMNNHQRLVFGNLFDSLGMTNDSNLKKPEVFSTATYYADSYESRFVSSPLVVLNNDRRLVLQIGSNEKGLEIPIVFDKENDCYYLSVTGGKRLKGELITVKNNDKEMIFFSFKEEKRPLYVFNFNIRLVENVNIQDLSESFYNGGLADYVARGGYDGLNLTKAFAVCFETGTFPDKGVLIALSRGKKSTYNDLENNKTYVSSKWEIVSSSHPNLLVHSYTNGLIPLGDVVYMSCGSSSSATKHLENVIDLTNDENTVIPVYYLHLQGANYQGNKIRLDWQPKNIGFASLKTLSPIVKKNFNEYIKGLEMTQNILDQKAEPIDLEGLKFTGDADLKVVEEVVEKPAKKRKSTKMDGAAAVDPIDFDTLPMF